MTMRAADPIYTIGHSTRSLEEFVDMLRGAGVTQLADVRSIPRSRTNPHYNLDTFPAALAHYQISHVHLPSLGGRRPREPSVDPSLNDYWQNQSFHNYADYAATAAFQAGLCELLALSERGATAIMCSEAVWWRCHRRIIADYLLCRGRTVSHLMGAGRAEEARLTPAAKQDGAKLIYPG
ncbi:DUF488 domain-containing protein [Sphingopyxis sp. MSC1_008]|jgi:uncharacterized protein (DUF488 family)|uniref:DUF488 domain-containing protein n=1 Tax=Sphingopyxis sp. MSC1_008 TaxID=2909265 RepID=UPI0020C05528|nr:DUF488 domain-containing protein [Sphingopyxis sp. MSC1_008]